MRQAQFADSQTDIVGVEEYSTVHVQGYITSSYRLLHENQTSIVALMRGGEPMAFGVNDAFPLATFVHASRPGDIKFHLQHQHTVMLVDSVVNSGKTVMHFVQHVRNLHSTIRIIVVAGPSVCKNSLWHLDVMEISVWSHFAVLTTTSPAAAPPTQATVCSIQRILANCVRFLPGNSKEKCKLH